MTIVEALRSRPTLVEYAAAMGRDELLCRVELERLRERPYWLGGPVVETDGERWWLREGQNDERREPS